MGAAKTTTDHEEIRRWVEQHGGHPATVRRTRSKGNVGIIRIDFPGFSGEESLQPIEWDEWFEKFDEQQLAFIYQQGKNTNFNKLVRRDPEQVRPSDRRRGPSRTTHGGRAAARALEGRRSSARTDRSRSEGARSSGARGQGTRSQGARSSGTRSQGARNSGARGQGARSQGTRSGGTRSQGARTDLASQTKAQLYQRARKAGVERSSTMNKPELIRALERIRAQPR